MTFVAHLENSPGVLARVETLFRRQNVALTSLTMAENASAGYLVTVEAPGSPETADLVLKPISGGSPITITLDWEDAPTNTQPIHEWLDETLVPVGAFYGEIKTDPDGDDEWTFPTEAGDLFTFIVRARLG